MIIGRKRGDIGGWRELYAFCWARFEEGCPVEIEWNVTMARPSLAKAIAHLLPTGYRVTLAIHEGGRARVTSCERIGGAS